MKLNHAAKRLLEHVQIGKPQLVDVAKPAVHTLAQAGLVEYEAWPHDPLMVLVWAASLTGNLYTKPKPVCPKGKGASRPVENTKPQTSQQEQTMATITLGVESMDVGKLGAKMTGVSIRAEVPNSALPAFLELVSNLTQPVKARVDPEGCWPRHTCTCHDNDEDKRPPYVGKPDNAFAPMDTE